MGNYINYCVYKRVHGGTKRFSDTRFTMPPESCVVPILVYIYKAQMSCGGIENNCTCKTM